MPQSCIRDRSANKKFCHKGIARPAKEINCLIANKYQNVARDKYILNVMSSELQNYDCQITLNTIAETTRGQQLDYI